ncbi:hypothetical protein [Lysobacter xanthus]
MRFIPTTPERVETLKKQAKRLQGTVGGKHADRLDRVARTAGYEHWHHVTLCLRETTGEHAVRGLLAEIEKILAAAASHTGRLVVTGPEACAEQPFVLFATEDGDAWMLDPVYDGVLCLRWRDERQSFHVVDGAKSLEIRWNGAFELNGPFFTVRTDHPAIGNRGIAGYPVEQLREVLDQLQSTDRRADTIFGRATALDLSDDVIRELVRTGWEEDRVRDAARRGAQYSPSRNTLLFPMMGSL